MSRRGSRVPRSPTRGDTRDNEPERQGRRPYAIRDLAATAATVPQGPACRNPLQLRRTDSNAETLRQDQRRSDSITDRDRETIRAYEQALQGSNILEAAATAHRSIDEVSHRLNEPLNHASPLLAGDILCIERRLVAAISKELSVQMTTMNDAHAAQMTMTEAHAVQMIALKDALSAEMTRMNEAHAAQMGKVNDAHETQMRTMNEAHETHMRAMNEALTGHIATVSSMQQQDASTGDSEIAQVSGKIRAATVAIEQVSQYSHETRKTVEDIREGVVNGIATIAAQNDMAKSLTESLINHNNANIVLRIETAVDAIKSSIEQRSATAQSEIETVLEENMEAMNDVRSDVQQCVGDAASQIKNVLQQNKVTIDDVKSGVQQSIGDAVLQVCSITVVTCETASMLC